MEREIIDGNIGSGGPYINLRLTWGLIRPKPMLCHENAPSFEAKLPGSIDTIIVVKNGIAGRGPTEMPPCPSYLGWNQTKLAQAGVPPTTDDQVVVNRDP